MLSELAIRDLAGIFAKVCRDFEAELVECSGEDDHVHLLVRYPPKVALSRLVNSLKGVSSRRLRDIRPEVSGRYHEPEALRAASHFFPMSRRRSARGLLNRWPSFSGLRR